METSVFCSCCGYEDMIYEYKIGAEGKCPNCDNSFVVIAHPKLGESVLLPFFEPPKLYIAAEREKFYFNRALCTSCSKSIQPIKVDTKQTNSTNIE